MTTTTRAGTLTLALGLLATLGVSGVARGQDTKPMMTTADVVARAVESMGGQERLEEIASVHMITSPPAEMGVAKAIVDAVFEKGMFRVEANLPDDEGKAVICNDGKHMWSMEPGADGYDVPSGADEVEELAAIGIMMAPQVQFGWALMDEETLGEATMGEFQGESCYSIEPTDDAKTGIATLFFHEKTCLPAGLRVDGPDDQDIDIVFKDWEVVEGVKMVKRSTLHLAPEPMEFTYGDVKFNSVEAKTFAMPDSVREIIEARKEEKAEDG